MRVAAMMLALFLGVGCSAPADGTDEGASGTAEQSVLSSKDLMGWGFTYLDFRADNTVVAKLANPQQAPLSITIVSTDGKSLFEVPIVRKWHDPVAGTAGYVKATSGGPLLSQHLDCGDQTYASSTLSSKALYISSTWFTVVTFKWCNPDYYKPPIPPNCQK